MSPADRDRVLWGKVADDGIPLVCHEHIANNAHPLIDESFRRLRQFNHRDGPRRRFEGRAKATRSSRRRRRGLGRRVDNASTWLSCSDGSRRWSHRGGTAFPSEHGCR